MIRGLNKIVEPQGLGYMMSTYTAHPGGFEVAEMDATKIAAKLMAAGLVVFAPISYGPGIEREMIGEIGGPAQAGFKLTHEDYIRSHEFWMPICERFYQRCDYAILAMTPGWVQSKGVAIEFYALLRAGIPIYFYDPDTESIMTMGELNDIAEEEFEALQARSAEIGTPFYLHEAADTQVEAALMQMSGRILRKLQRV
jgi:hypothetical protein